MSVTLVLLCKTWAQEFIAVAEDFPFVPRPGDQICNHQNVCLNVSRYNPACHHDHARGTFILSSADTTSRVNTHKAVVESFRDAGWKILTPEEVKTQFPFFTW